MSNLDKAKELYERINHSFTAYGEVPEYMIDDLKEICDALTDEEFEQLEDGNPN